MEDVTAHIQTEESYCYLALHRYIVRNDTCSFDEYLAAIDQRELNLRDGDGRTLLFQATILGRLHIIRSLLVRGSDVTIPDARNNTPLHAAVDNGDSPIVRLLLSTGLCDVDARNNQSETPLLRATYFDYHDVVDDLLKAGADMDVVDKNGRSPLLLGLWEGSNRSVTGLVKHGCRSDVVDSDGCTAFHIAIHSPVIETINIAKLLYRTGYDVRKDREWLSSEAKHPRFYEDDTFYCIIMAAAGCDVNNISCNTTNQIHRPAYSGKCKLLCN